MIIPTVDISAIEPKTAARLALGKDTCLSGRFAHSWEVLTYRTVTAAILLITYFWAVVLGMILYLLIPAPLDWHQVGYVYYQPMLLVAIGLLAAGYIIASNIAAAWAVEKVYVLRKTDDGLAFLDEQQWWKHDVRRFPDSWRVPFGRSRHLFIDAIGDEPIKFDPWINQLPMGAGAATPQRFAAVAMSANAIKTVAKAELGLQELIQTGIVAAVIGGCILGIIVAGARISEVLGFAA